MADCCETCSAWVEVPGQPKSRRIGTCRAQAPQLLLLGMAPPPLATGNPVPVTESAFPQTRPDIWCRQFAPRAAAQMTAAGFKMLDLGKLDVSLIEAPVEGVEQ